MFESIWRFSPSLSPVRLTLPPFSHKTYPKAYLISHR
jgi:hypothetical protein